jgi:hypothetical protein
MHAIVNSMFKFVYNLNETLCKPINSFTYNIAAGVNGRVSRIKRQMRRPENHSIKRLLLGYIPKGSRKAIYT